MKKIRLTLAIIFGLVIQLQAQSFLNIGGGYYGENISSPGLVVEFEYEKFFTEELSLPLRMDLIFYVTPEYNNLVIDIHKGLRKYFDSGLFIEQSIGIGLVSSFYTLESIWYMDKYGNTVLYAEGANIGVMPSVTIGIGYNLTRGKSTANTIWLRPKIYWSLGVRSLNMPYGAIQLGYTYNIK